MHHFVCSLQRPSAPVISFIIATSSVIRNCLIAAMILITVNATPCTSLNCTTISMADTTVYIFLIASLLFSRKKNSQLGIKIL